MLTLGYDGRRGLVLANMEAQGVDCFLIGVSSTLRYLTGYAGKADERLLMLVLAPGKKPFLVINQMTAGQMTQSGVTDLCLWRDGQVPVELLLTQLKERGIAPQRVAVEKSLATHFLLAVQAGLKADFVVGNSLVDPLRLYKDPQEREWMTTACAMADKAFVATMERGRGWIGHSEKEFMAALAFEMSHRGLSLPSSIVAVGDHAATPHHVNGDTLIQDGKCLLVDFGANYMGYYTDMTRTVHFGPPDDTFREIYDIVLEALYRGHRAAQNGNCLQDVDRAARGYITEKGYGEYFIHRTGHGIGLDGHEGPPAGEGSLTKIAPGMAFSIEPGIYLPGRYGVRIEDQALMTEEGLTILHTNPRELCVY